MGMRGHLRQITLAELEQLQRDPQGTEAFVRGKAQPDYGKMLAVLQSTQKIALDARASGALTDPAERERIRALIFKELDGAGVDVGLGTNESASEDGLN